MEAERQTPEEREAAIALLTRKALALTEMNISIIIRRMREKNAGSSD